MRFSTSTKIVTIIIGYILVAVAVTAITGHFAYGIWTAVALFGYQLSRPWENDL